LDKLKTLRTNIGIVKNTAEDLSQADITVTLSYKGEVVVTMGSKATPKLSTIMTRTKAIEINNTKKTR
jgi:hypothetical protein